MWPHRIALGVGKTAVVVGTDAPELIDLLETWRIDDVGGLVDYGIELHPRAPDHRGPRPLGALQHGLTCVVRSSDAGQLTRVLLRMLASHTRPAGEGQVRLALMPVERNGVAVLVAPALLAGVSDRRLEARGIEAVRTISSLVDTRVARVLVDPPLGSAERPRDLALGGWWLPASDPDSTLSPGHAVAEVMQVALDVSVDNARATLAGVADLLQRVPASTAPEPTDDVLDALEEALEDAAATAGTGRRQKGRESAGG